MQEDTTRWVVAEDPYEANVWRVVDEQNRHWLAVIRFNGELMVSHQQEIAGQILSALQSGEPAEGVRYVGLLLKVRCSFCDFTAATADELKGHLSPCPNHPAVIRLEQLRRSVDIAFRRADGL